MKISGQRNTLPLLFIALTLVFIGLSQFSVNSSAQEQTQLPARSGYINDFAGVVDESTKQRLEVMLGNLKRAEWDRLWCGNNSNHRRPRYL